MHTLRRRGSLHPDELAASLDGYVVLDVRERSDWVAGHIAGSIHLPLDGLDDHRWDDSDRRLPVAVVANSDDDAQIAVRALQARDRDAVVLSGGTAAWRSSGHSLVTNKSDQPA